MHSGIDSDDDDVDDDDDALAAFTRCKSIWFHLWIICKSLSMIKHNDDDDVCEAKDDILDDVVTDADADDDNGIQKVDNVRL